jgi:hypothetical protein
MSTYHCADDKEFAIEISDGADHISLTPTISVKGHKVTEFTLALRGEDVRQFIAELTAIADSRGL